MGSQEPEFELISLKSPQDGKMYQYLTADYVVQAYPFTFKKYQDNPRLLDTDLYPREKLCDTEIDIGPTLTYAKKTETGWKDLMMTKKWQKESQCVGSLVEAAGGKYVNDVTSRTLKTLAVGADGLAPWERSDSVLLLGLDWLESLRIPVFNPSGPPKVRYVLYQSSRLNLNDDVGVKLDNLLKEHGVPDDGSSLRFHELWENESFFEKYPNITESQCYDKLNAFNYGEASDDDDDDDGSDNDDDDDDDGDNELIVNQEVELYSAEIVDNGSIVTIDGMSLSIFARKYNIPKDELKELTKPDNWDCWEPKNTEFYQYYGQGIDDFVECSDSDFEEEA